MLLLLWDIPARLARMSLYLTCPMCCRQVFNTAELAPKSHNPESEALVQAFDLLGAVFHLWHVRPLCESISVDWDLFRSRGHQLPSFTVLSPDLWYLMFPGKPQVEAPCDLYLEALHTTPTALPFKICWVPVHTRQHFDMGRNGRNLQMWPRQWDEH